MSGGSCSNCKNVQSDEMQVSRQRWKNGSGADWQSTGRNGEF